MKNCKKRNRGFAFLTAMAVALGMLLPKAVVVQAADELQVAQYTQTSGTASCGAAQNTATFNGSWKASIPMGKVMQGIETQMRLAAVNGFYPHGKDGANTIAYVEYTVTFPAGAVIDSAAIQKTNATSMFNTTAFSHNVSGQSVTFKLPLKDVNWSGIYEYYLKDGGGASDKTIDITIPYTVTAGSLDEAKEFEKQTVTAKGEFETHASGSFLWAPSKVVYGTDVSSQPLAPGFSAANCFGQPSNEDVKQQLDLDADLKLGDDTGNTAVTKQKTEEMDFVGTLDVKAIKEQMAKIENTYAGAEASNIKLENLESTFTASLMLPYELSFTKTEATLSGANGVFEVGQTTLENADRVAVVTLKLAGAESITSYDKLRDAINRMDDELKVTFRTVKFNEAAEGGKTYEVTGLVTGRMEAKATHTVSGKAINFNLQWDGKQSEGGKSVANPGEIAISVHYPAATEQTIQKAGNLDGDLLVNEDTQHTKVPVFKKADTFKVTGLLNVRPIKTQMKQVEDTYQADQVATNIAISDIHHAFTASMELPEGLRFTENAKDHIELKGANGKFKISDAKIEGKKLSATMVVAAEVNTFKEIKEAVDGVEDHLKVEVGGVTFADDAVSGQNYTIKGDVTGVFQAKATHKLTGKVIRFDYKWKGVQLDGGEDSTDPTTDAIQLTVKYLAEKDVPADPKDPSKPADPKKPSKPTDPKKPSKPEAPGKVDGVKKSTAAPKTGDSPKVLSYSGAMLLSIAGGILVFTKRKEEQGI